MVDEKYFEPEKHEDEGLSEIDEELVGEEYEQNRQRLMREMTAKMEGFDLAALEHLAWVINAISESDTPDTGEDKLNG